MTNRPQIADLVTQLCQKFGKPIDDALMQTFIDALDGVAIESVETLIKLLVRECQYFPRPAEVLKHIKAGREIFKLSEPQRPAHWKLETYDCPLCNDTGYVTAWHHVTMQHAIYYRLGKTTEPRYNRKKYTMAAPCTCSLGDQFKEHRTTKDGKVIATRNVVRYCPVRMVRPDFAEPQDDRSLMEWADRWIDNHNSNMPHEYSKLRPNYTEAFDEF